MVVILLLLLIIPLPENNLKLITQCTDFIPHQDDMKSPITNIDSTISANPQKSMQKTDIIGQITGDFGKWQLRTVFFIFLTKIPSSWFMACIIYTAPIPQHGEVFCRPVQNTENFNYTIWEHILRQNKSDWIEITHPFRIDPAIDEYVVDICNVYDDSLLHATSYYLANSQSKPWKLPERNASIIPCDEFVHVVDYKSIITDYDLICSREILVATTQFFHLFGVLTGGIIATNLLKFFSPKSVMLFGMFTQILCGNITGLVKNYWMHIFFRCLSAACCAQMYTAGQMIFTDITAGKPRTIITTCFEQFWSIGLILLPGLANMVNSWSQLYMAISMPTFILIILWRWIPNSPRWLIQHGHIAEAKKILIQSAEYNEKPYVIPSDLDELLKQHYEAVQSDPPPAGWWSIWKGPKALRHMICVHLIWSIYVPIYYGMLLNIKNFDRDYIEINTIVEALSEISGVFIGLILLLFTTKKWLWTGLFNILAGCFAYTIWLVPSYLKGINRVALQMITGVFCKMSISSTLAILATCTIELVCQEKRKITSFSTTVWARIWLLTAPYMGATNMIGRYIPQTVFASLAILGGFISMAITSPRTIPKKQQNELTNNDLTTVKKTQIIYNKPK